MIRIDQKSFSWNGVLTQIEQLKNHPLDLSDRPQALGHTIDGKGVFNHEDAVSVDGEKLTVTCADLTRIPVGSNLETFLQKTVASSRPNNIGPRELLPAVALKADESRPTISIDIDTAATPPAISRVYQSQFTNSAPLTFDEVNALLKSGDLMAAQLKNASSKLFTEFNRRRDEPDFDNAKIIIGTIMRGTELQLANHCARSDVSVLYRNTVLKPCFGNQTLKPVYDLRPLIDIASVDFLKLRRYPTLVNQHMLMAHVNGTEPPYDHDDLWDISHLCNHWVVGNDLAHEGLVHMHERTGPEVYKYNEVYRDGFGTTSDPTIIGMVETAIQHGRIGPQLSQELVKRVQNDGLVLPQSVKQKLPGVFMSKSVKKNLDRIL